MLDRLKLLEREIRVAIIGMGAMGRGLFHQCRVTPGVACVAVADIKQERSIEAVVSSGCDYAIVDDSQSMGKAIREGVVAVCADGDLLAKCEAVDVLIESSNSVGEAGAFAETALEHGRHLVLMNAEADLIFGPYLQSLACANGVVFTSCGGDQHTVIKLLADDLQLWGFELVMAGNIKGYLDRYANPTTIIPEAEKRHLDYRMAAGYTDGTKLNIEMALVANALGLSTPVPGMHGPTALHLRDVFDLFDFPALRQAGKPVVDYLLGADPSGGVFVVGYCDHVYQRRMLAYYKMGDGPYYLFYRPYHLCHIEAIRCVVEACLEQRSLLKPDFGFRTNVYAYAKRRLRTGEMLDGIGGYACYGLIENCPQPGVPAGLPICLSEHVILNRDVEQDEKIMMEDVTFGPGRRDFDLYSRAVRASSAAASSRALEKSATGLA